MYTFGLREQTNPDMLQWLQSIGADVCKVAFHHCSHSIILLSPLTLLISFLIQTHRGGLTTYHGPGQLVCYPILNLRSLRVGVREYINALEEAMIAAVQKLGVVAHRSQHTGVWVKEEKLGAIGEKRLCEGGSMHCVSLQVFRSVWVWLTMGLPSIAAQISPGMTTSCLVDWVTRE